MRRSLQRIRDFRRAHSIEELDILARRRVPYFSYEYVRGGSEDEHTLRRNREAFNAWGFVPRTLVDVTARDTSTTVLGRRQSVPMLVGPTGFNGMLRHGADAMIARAAARAGISSCLSAFSNMTLEDVARESQSAGGDCWFQLYILRDRSLTENLLERAHAAGVQTIVVTTDAVVFGCREWDRRNFLPSTKLTWRAALDAAMHPRWLFDVMIPHGPPRFANFRRKSGEIVSVSLAASWVTGALDASLGWDDLRWLRERWPGKLVVKSVLRADDALRSRDCGADAVILSNHGGRQLDGCISGFDALPAVRAAVGPDYTLLVDGGFRRGHEILKAVALGASAVVIGRPVLYGVAAGGEAGALHALTLLKTQIDRSLGQLGVCSLAEVTPDLLQRF